MKLNNPYQKEQEGPVSGPGLKSGQKGISALFFALKSANPLYSLSVTVQILTGMLMVGLSMTAFIQPIGVAVLCNVLGCIATMLGLYQFYDILKKNKGAGNLAHEAIRNAIDNRN
jgi:hypothetical protein